MDAWMDDTVDKYMYAYIDRDKITDEIFKIETK